MRLSPPALEAVGARPGPLAGRAVVFLAAAGAGLAVRRAVEPRGAFLGALAGLGRQAVAQEGQEVGQQPAGAVALDSAAVRQIVNDQGELLSQKRSDDDRCGLPGSAMNIDESIGQAVIHEVKEETSLDVEPTGVVAIHSDPGHVIAYADGEVRQEFSICFTARLVGGQLAVGDQESTEVRFVQPGELDGLPMGRSTRLRIQHFLEQRATPYFA